MKKYCCKAFVLLLLALIPAACSDQMDLAEQKMQEIAGDYLLTGLSDRKTSYLPLLPDSERESIQHARIAKSQDNRWYFEYILPVPVSGSQFSYHKTSQDILWEPAFGRYFIGRMSESDLESIGFKPNKVRLELSEDKITFRYLDLDLACVWKKQ